MFVPHLYDGRNKTFFFFNFEQIQDRAPDNITATVPTAVQRAGDFSQTFSGGTLIKIYDPASTMADPAKPGSFIRTQFPNNQIPASRIDPNGASLLQYYPAPNLPGITNNYAGAGTRGSKPTKYYGRIDESLSDANRLFFRYGITYSPANTPSYTAVAFPGEGTNCNEGNANSTPWVAALSDTATFRPNLIGEFRVSYTRQLNTCALRSQGFDLTKLGLPAYLKNASLDQHFPLMEVTDFTALGPARASHYTDAENTPEAQAHVTWLKGSHSVRAGIDYLFLAFDIFRPDYPSGDFQFSRGYTQGPDPSVASGTSGYGLATLLLGAPTGGSFTTGPSLASSQKSYNIYLQDDWQECPESDGESGARWEYQTPYNERYNHLAYLTPTPPIPLRG